MGRGGFRFGVLCVLIGLSGVRARACVFDLQAATNSLAEEVFVQAFHDRSVYTPSQCAANTHRLLERMKTKKVAWESGEVVYIAGPGGFFPSEPRNPFGEWPYHVVLVLGGRVYDLDWTTQPQVLALRNYFERNVFGGRSFQENAAQRVLQRLNVLRIPAPDFFHNFPASATPAAMQTYVAWLEKNFAWKPATVLSFTVQN